MEIFETTKLFKATLLKWRLVSSLWSSRFFLAHLAQQVMWDLASLTSLGQIEQNLNWIFITEFLLKAHFAFLQIIQNVCTTFFYQVSDTDLHWTCIECLKNTTKVIRQKMNKVTTNRTSFLCINHNGHHNTELRT